MEIGIMLCIVVLSFAIGMVLSRLDDIHDDLKRLLREKR